MIAPPTDEITLVFTDIEGSSGIWEAIGDDFHPTLAIHDTVMRTAMEEFEGYEVQTAGDSYFVAFASARNAISFCLAVQQRLHESEWPEDLLDNPALLSFTAIDHERLLRGIRVRMGVHTGYPWTRQDPTTLRMDYGGQAANRASRLAAAAHGGQVLVSNSTWQIVRALFSEKVSVQDLGQHALHGLAEPEQIRQLLPLCLAQRRFPPIRTVDLRKTNLKARQDSFIGRDGDLAELVSLLEEGVRLVTVLGPGGTGKTRLAEQLLRLQLGGYPGGAWFCDLTEARSQEGIFTAVAHALDVALIGDDLQGQLANIIERRGKALIILDNFEQVVEYATESVLAWLKGAPQAQFVVTSRTRLDVEGERLYLLDPLPLDEAVRLFEDRAAAAKPDFVITADNRQTIIDVVEELDRMSLAIELAAARLRMFTPSQLRQRLNERFRLLRGNRRDHTSRLSTLRGAIDWSWQLLQPWERLALAQCSVFRGGFTVEAAESVLNLEAWPDAPWPEDVLQSLVDQSLLQMNEPRAGYVRLRMYESIRVYGTEKLAEEGAVTGPDGASLTGPQQQTATGMAHARHLTRFSADAYVDSLRTHGGVQRRWQLNLEMENILAAFEFAVGAGQDLIAAQCALATGPVFTTRGPFLSGLDVLDRAQALPEIDQDVRRRMRFWQGLLCRFGGQPETAAQHLEAALQANREAGDRRGEGILLTSMAILERERGQLEDAMAHFEEALDIHREVGNRHGEAVVLASIGLLRYDQGRKDTAHAHYTQALSIYREVGDRQSEGRLLGSMGLIHRERNELEDASQQYQEALEIAREVGDRLSEGITLGNLGDLAIEQGRWLDADALLQHCVSICDETLPIAAGAFRGSLALVSSQRGDTAQARKLLEHGANRLRGVHALELGKLLCKRGMIELEADNVDAARKALEKAESIAEKAAAVSESALGIAVTELRSRLNQEDQLN